MNDIVRLQEQGFNIAEVDNVKDINSSFTECW